MNLKLIKNCYTKFLSQFVNKLEHPEVDLKNYVQRTLSVTEQLSKLSDGIQLLDKELQRQVLEKHEDLVSQATWVEKLQGVLSIMQIHVQSLVSSVERVKAKVAEPYQKLETQSIVLTRLHETTDLLRRSSRIQHLTRKLPDLDAPRAAQVLSELDELHKDVDLSGLEILEPDEKLIKQTRTNVEQQANRIVSDGLNTLNTEKVAIGIDIMDKLNLTEVEVQKMMDKWLTEVKNCIRDSLNMENLIPPSTRGGAGRVAGVSIPANIQNFRSKLWTKWENTLNGPVYTTCAQMAVIQSVLNNRISYSRKLTGNDERSEVAFVFWSQVDEILKDQLKIAAKNSSYMKQALEGEYPKLLGLHIELHKKLKSLNAAESSSKYMFPSIGKCVKQFETAYLSRSVNVLIGAVQEMFPPNEAPPQPPSIDKVDALVKTISRELDVSLVDEALAGPVAKNVAKAISLFCQKGEQMLINTPAATQVIESQTPGQELNVGVANIIYYFCEQLKNTVSNNPKLSKNTSAHINDAIYGGERLTQQILNPLLASILVAIESILLTMHKEDYDLKEYSGSNSLYMRELQAFIARAVTSYLSPFHNQSQVAHSCMEVASRTIELFLRHISLLRPLNEKGRQKILFDFKCLEEALSPLCMQLSELGAIYSTLRSIRPLFTASPKEVATSPVLGQVIPHSLACTILFSMGPSQLPSPHQSVGWSINKLSEWLDTHTNERDRLELLSGALKSYAKADPKAKSSELYNIINDLIHRGNAYVLSDTNAL